MILPVLKSKKISIVLASIAVAAFICSFCLFMVKKGGARRSFIFPSVENGAYIVEIRRLPHSHISDVEYYINELMLGPQTERCRRIFAKETKVLSCMQKNKILYVDLSQDIVNPENENRMLPVRDSIELFKKNIKRNFPSISTVKVFVGGVPAYEGY